MTRYMKTLTLTLLLAILCGGPVYAQQADGATAGPEGISLDFKDVELAELTRVISELTGENFLFDDTLKGKVTIISPRPMSRDEAYKVFLSVLNVKGFTVVPSGKVNKVVALRAAVTCICLAAYSSFNIRIADRASSTSAKAVSTVSS